MEDKAADGGFPSHNMVLNYLFPRFVHLLTETRFCERLFPPTCYVHEPASTLVGQTFCTVSSLQGDTRVQTAAGKAGRGKKRIHILKPPPPALPLQVHAGINGGSSQPAALLKALSQEGMFF